MPALRPSSGQAPAGIQESQAQASGESPWIPASAGMTPLPSSPQNDVNVGQEPALSLLSSHPEQPLDAAALPTQRAWSMRGLVFMSLVLLVAVSLTVQYLSRPSLSTQSSALSTAAPQALPLPDKPSLIVLPFTNLSRDPDQDYFSDGLTDVLTGKLSSIASLFVIARHSAFTYKGKAVKVQDVSREMGVQYVLEGSVQKAEQRIRITTQLIDAITGHQLWSEQYDRPLQDIFALQDEIVQRIVTTLKLQLSLLEQDIRVRKRTDNLDAYDAFLRGEVYFFRTTKEDNVQARQMYEHALALDPQYVDAYVQLGHTYYFEWNWRWSTDPQTLERALRMMQQALALDEASAIAHALSGTIYAQKQRYEQALAEEERAIALNPNNADTYIFQAEALNYVGRPEDALRAEATAMRLNPHYPSMYLADLGWAQHMTGRYAEAIATLKELLRRNPNHTSAYVILALSYLGQWNAQEDQTSPLLEQAMTAIPQSVAVNDLWYANHLILGSLYLYQHQYEQALAEMERAVALAPTVADTSAGLAAVLSCMGQSKAALEATARALRLNPSVPDSHYASVGFVYMVVGHYEEALEPLQRYLHRYPNILPAHLMLAAVYGELDQAAEAQKEVAEVLRLNPNFSLEVYKQRIPIKDPAVLERHIAALRKAGLK